MRGQDASEPDSDDKEHTGDIALEANVVGAETVKNCVEIP